MAVPRDGPVCGPSTTLTMALEASRSLVPTPQEMSDGADLFIEQVAQWVTVWVKPTSISDMVESLRAEVEDIPADNPNEHARRAYALYLVNKLERHLTEALVDADLSPDA